jgi:hypothetical protein
LWLFANVTFPSHGACRIPPTSHMDVLSRQQAFTRHANFCVLEGRAPDMKAICCANLGVLTSGRGGKEQWRSGAVGGWRYPRCRVVARQALSSTPPVVLAAAHPGQKANPGLPGISLPREDSSFASAKS